MLLADTGAIVRRLNGYSGACLYLLKTGNTWFVRKLSQDARLNDRLQVQCNKQRDWAAIPDKVVECPQIYGEGLLDGLFYFDMEFIQGLDGVSFLTAANHEEIRKFSKKISENFRFISKQMMDSKKIYTDDLIFLYFKKLLSIFENSPYDIPSDVQAKLFFRLKEFADVEIGSPTLCHGDFTLENLIINHEGVLYAYDFLDSPFEHYWQDIAKFFQDVEGGWYLRKHYQISKYILSYVKQKIYTEIAELAPEYLKVHPLLMALNFARIIPYVQNQADHELIISRIRYYTNDFQNDYEEFNETYRPYVW